MKKTLQRIDLKPERQPAAGCVVVLHGRGTNGYDLVPIVQAFRLPRLRYLFPHAPFPVPFIWEGRAWYELPPYDREGILESRQLLFNLLEELEGEGLSSGQIALMGFSQGAVMSLDVGVRYPHRLAGIIALSGYLPFPESLHQEKSPVSQGLPVLLAHGTEDPVVPILGSRQAAQILKEEEFSVRLLEYRMGHEVIPEEVAEIRRFLQDLFPDYL